ncbi:hypothetical protein [Algivirga pacifica]|uniref:STAS/SEC14 domain-containing protein n=1 Tax=Algivirga pacifica TaxID=1162670 RepID=A0ABP9D866_9BACT
MKRTFDNDYLTLEVDEQHKILHYTWKLASEELTEDTYLVEANRILNTFLSKGCRRIIGDDTNSRVIISPELQQEVITNILSMVEGKLEKFAHVASEDIFVNVSVKQMFEDNTALGGDFEELYFDSVAKAKKWVYEN